MLEPSADRWGLAMKRAGDFIHRATVQNAHFDKDPLFRGELAELSLQGGPDIVPGPLVCQSSFFVRGGSSHSTK